MFEINQCTILKYYSFHIYIYTHTIKKQNMCDLYIHTHVRGEDISLSNKDSCLGTLNLYITTGYFGQSLTVISISFKHV